MDLPKEDELFLKELSNKFFITSLNELSELIESLKGISITTPILGAFKKILEDTQASIDKGKYIIPSVELFDEWKKFLTDASSSKVPELETYAVYFWNFMQMSISMMVSPSDDLFLPLSMKLIESCLGNIQIASKFKNLAAEAYFRYNFAYQFFMLFKYGPKNKEFLTNALKGFKEIIPLYEELKNHKQLTSTLALIANILQNLAKFYVDTEPKKFAELIEEAYDYIMKGVKLAREKSPSDLSGILIDASASVASLGRIQIEFEKGKYYLEQSIALAEEGIEKVDPKSKDLDGLKEGLFNNLGISYSFLGDIYQDHSKKMENYYFSLEKKFQSLEYAKRAGYTHMIIRDLSNIGQSYHKMAIVERANPEKYMEFIQKSIKFFEDALAYSERKELDSGSEEQLLTAGEALSSLYARMLTLITDHKESLDWLSKKVQQDRKNIQLARQFNVRPILIVNNCMSASDSLENVILKLDDVMAARKLREEQMAILNESIKILEELKIDDVKLAQCLRKVCGISQSLSRLQPNAQKKYEILLYGKDYGDKAYQLGDTLDNSYVMISVCDNYGLLVHDIGHAIEGSDVEKAREYFTESIKIFQKGLEVAKGAPESMASQAVLLDYIGGSYRDLANLSKEIETQKEYYIKSAEVKEESLLLFEAYKKAPYDTAVTADSLAITLQQLGRIEENSEKAVEIFQKAIKYTKRAEELFIQLRINSKAFRCQVTTLAELKPNLILHQMKLEKDPKKRWDYLSEARKILMEGAEIGKISPMFRVLTEYLLWEYPKPLENGVEHSGYQVIWDAEQKDLKSINKSYDRTIQFTLNLQREEKLFPISDVKFELEFDRDVGHLVITPLIRVIFQNNKEIHLLIPTYIKARSLERKPFRLINPSSETLMVQLVTKKSTLSSTEKHLAIVGERNIFMIAKKPEKITEKMAVIELPQANIECLYQINILPRFSGIMSITNPDIKKWKYNLGACLIEGALMFEGGPHIVETDFSPIIFMDEKGNLPTKFFQVQSDMKTVSGSLVDLNVRYPRIIRKIFIMGEIFKEKPPYERLELLNLLKDQITNIATVNDPFSGITILTSDTKYFDELYPLIERNKMALAQNTDFIRLTQVAKLLEIRYIPENEVLTEIGHTAANIRWLTFENIAICDSPILAFLAVPWCRFTDAFLFTSAECQTEKGKKILENAKNLYIIGDLENQIPVFPDKQVEHLAKDVVTLSYQLHERLTSEVKENWEHFLKTEFRDLFPQLRKEEFGESVIVTSKEANDLSYLILASNYAAAKLSSILLIDRDEKKLKIESDLFKQLDSLSYKGQYEETGRSANLQEKLMSKLFAFSKDLRQKYFDEKYIKLLDQAKFISVITNIPLPFELMQYGEGESFLSLEKAVGRLCSTSIAETSILIQYSVLQSMMQSTDIKKATIISPKYFDRYTLYYGEKEVTRGSSLLGNQQNLGKDNVELLVNEKLTKQQFINQLQKNPWLFIHYIGHGDLVDQESAFMVQPSEYTDLVPIRAHDLPDYIAGQPLFIANACLSGRYQESADGLSGLVFEIIKRGAISFIGTLWEVDDYFASEFIAGLYLELLNGKFLGDAVQKSRRGILDKKDVTYGAYILFGDPMVRVR